MNPKAFFSGPERVDVSVPEWFKDRAEHLVKALGEDHADVQLFKEILAEGKISESAVERADALAASNRNPEVFLLATEIASYALNAIQAITQIVPLILGKAA